MNPAISSFIAPAPVAPSTPAAPPRQNGFAQLLSQRQAMADDAAPAADAPASAAEGRLEEGSPSNAARPPAPAAGRERPLAKAKPAEAASAADEASENTTDLPAVAEPADPALADWLAALNLPGLPPPADLPVTASGGAGAVRADGLLLTGQGAELAAGAELPAQKADLVADTAARPGLAARADAAQLGAEHLRAVRDSHDPAASPHAEARSHAAWQAAAERVAAPAEAAARRDEFPALAGPGAAAHTPAPARLAEAAAAPVIAMATPATAPEFPQALGVQISVLARDGVQHAELHLNPAEMGPISVQIVLEGTQAQVNFGADSAATRHIIEGGLPELAAALRDAGFTLSGGGVHQQARGQRDGGDAAGEQGSPSRSDDVGEIAAAPQRINARVAAGGVDLYA